MTLLEVIDHTSVQAGDAKAWAAKINAEWRKSLESVIEAGRILLEAKASLLHGQFTLMVEQELDFNPRTAQRLMAIAQDVRLANPVISPRLPKAWTTLYELTTLTDEEFDRALKEEIIHPKMERADVARVRPEASEPLPNGARAIMSSRVEGAESSDFFPTPPWSTRALIERVLFGRLKIDVTRASACEPACGEGHIAEVLEEYFAEVGAADIHDYGYGQIQDFLADEVMEADEARFDWYITNPPFLDKAEAFVLRALELAKRGVAMFVRLQWLESEGRYENIFKNNPPTLIAFFVERVNLCRGHWDPEGGTATAYIWLVWVKGMRPQAPFWIPPGCRQACARPDDVERFTQHPVMRRAA